MTTKKIIKDIEYINSHRILPMSPKGICSKIIRFIKKRRLFYECEKKGAFIPFSAQIGKGISFPHGVSGIFISQGAKIGNNVVIFHQVTIGSNTLKDSKGYGSPIIGNNVYIGAGAKIIGNVTIGDNVRIGANASITKDVPPNATVVMSEPKIILHDYSRNNSFVNYKKE